MAKPTPIPWLTDGGLTGALMREHDWSKSPLGHPNEWSPALRSAVGLLLGSDTIDALIRAEASSWEVPTLETTAPARVV